MIFERLLGVTNIARANQPQNYFLFDYCDTTEEVEKRVVSQVDYLQAEIVEYLPWREKLNRFLAFNDCKLYLLIVLTCTFMSLAALLISNAADHMLYYRNRYFTDHLLLLAPFSISCGLMATFICSFSPAAEGSGVPELKSTLSGTVYFDFFGLRTFVCKYFAIFFVHLTGLGVGFEATFSHLSAIVAHQLFKLPFFHKLTHIRHNWYLALGASASLGMVIVFGAPIGGIIFAIEIYTSSFKVNNMFKFFVASTVSYFLFVVLKDVFGFQGIRGIGAVYRNRDLPHYALLGVLEGAAAYLLMFVFARFLVFRRQCKHFIFRNRYAYTIAAVGLNSLLICPQRAFFASFKTVIIDLINCERLSESPRRLWGATEGVVVAQLLYALFARFFQVILFATSPIPFGVFTPGLVFGAAVGRLYGEIVVRLFGAAVLPRHFALAGLGAFLSAFTHTLSPMIFIIEMTGEMGMLLPVLLVQLVAFGASAAFNMGMFELVIAVRKLPFMPSMLEREKAMTRAGQVCAAVEASLGSDATLFDVVGLLKGRRGVNPKELVPVVHGEGRVVQGYLSFEALGELVQGVLQGLRSAGGVGQSYKGVLSAVLTAFEREGLQPSERTLAALADGIAADLSQLDFVDARFEISPMIPQSAKQRPSCLATRRVSESRRASLFAGGRVPSGGSPALELRAKPPFDVDLLLRRVRIDWNDRDVQGNWFPIRVFESAELLKVHFLFLTTKTPVVWIEDRAARLVGHITYDAFLAFKVK